MLPRTAVVIVSTLIVAEYAAGQSVSYSSNFSFHSFTKNPITLRFPQLDPNVGTVTSFSYSLTGSRSVTSATVENLSSTTQNLLLWDSIAIAFPGFNGGGLSCGTGRVLGPFDGVSDFSGDDAAQYGFPPTTFGGSSIPSYHDFTPLQGTGTFPVVITRRFSVTTADGVDADAAYRIDYDGGVSMSYKFTLTYVVPEPSALVLLGAGVVALLGYVRRRPRPA